MNLRTQTLLAVLALAGAAGCAPDRMSLEPYGICSMPDDCSFSGGCDGYALGTIGFNTADGDALEVGIELRNQSPNNANPGTGRVNSNDAHVTGYTIEYGPGGPGTLTFYDGNQPVPAGGAGVVWVTLLLSGAPMGLYQANISFIGYYDNGREFITEPFPIGLWVHAIGNYACPKAGDVVSCPPLYSATSAQNLFACTTP